MTPEERQPKYMFENGLLEPVNDFEHSNRTIPAGRLGYRITDRFVRQFFGRVFDNPDKLFEEAILRPELQDADAFADGVLYITEAQQQVAQQYLDDRSIDDACPPLQVLLRIMAEGSFEGKTERDPEIRRMFTCEALLASDWYRDRLEARWQRDVDLWSRHVSYLDDFLSNPHNQGVADRLDIDSRRQRATRQLDLVNSSEYLRQLNGMLGTDPAVMGR